MENLKILFLLLLLVNYVTSQGIHLIDNFQKNVSEKLKYTTLSYDSNETKLSSPHTENSSDIHKHKIFVKKFTTDIKSDIDQHSLPSDTSLPIKNNHQDIELITQSSIIEHGFSKINKPFNTKTKKIKDEIKKGPRNNFFTINQENSELIDLRTSNAESFKAIVNLFDHFQWQISDIVNSPTTMISKNCAIDMETYLIALKNNTEWAQKAYDASGHYRGLIFFRNNVWVGEKLYCEEINLQNHLKGTSNIELGFFATRFKIIYPEISDPIFQLGECLPKTCTTKDIKTILNNDPNIKHLKSSNTSEIDVVIIDVRNVPGNYSLLEDTVFQVICAISLFILTIVILATFYESNLRNMERKKQLSKTNHINEVLSIHTIKANEKIFNNENNNNNNNNDETQHNIEKNKEKEFERLEVAHEKSSPKKLKIRQELFLCFSIQSNAKAILCVDKPQEESISCIHGIRVLSLFWIILVHTYLQVFQMGENRFRRNISERTLIYQVVGNATFSVDSFFFISGLLVTFIFLKTQKPNADTTNKFYLKGFLRSISMFMYRYIRLTPIYLLVIFYHYVTLKYIFNNSVFYPSVADHVTCGKYWWRNILYINNWFPLTDICMIWSWYLSNDMQFYIVAVLLLILSSRHPKAAILTLGLILITSWGTSGFFSIFHNYTHKVSQPFESFDFLYDKPWQRIGCYIIGICTGYIIHKFKNPPKIPRWLNLTLWLLSISLLAILIFGVWKGELSILSTAFYVSVGHSAWGLGLVWIILSCYWNLSNTINEFLSYQGFLPFSRLTYCMYLIHPSISISLASYMQGPIHLNHIIIFIIFLGNIGITFLISLIISLIFEAPIIRISRIVFRK